MPFLISKKEKNMKRTDQKRVFKLVSYETALKKLFEVAHTIPAKYEIIPVQISMGRVLAEDIMAKVDIPQTDQASVDGYALKSEDTIKASLRESVTLKIVAKLYPWSAPTGVTISKGQAAYVTCGAPIPRGADAVVKVENTLLNDGKIEVRHAVKTGENIIKAGEDIKKESLILEKCKVLRPQDLGILAGIGIRRVKVFKRPKVAIIATGSELFELSKKDPKRIVDNYALTISGLISDLGGIPIRLGIAADDLSEIQKKINEALEKADIIVTIGGCSMGEKDLVPEALNSFGEPGICVHGIKVKPGKVTGFGVIRGKPAVMLPGLIASTIAGFYLILAPLIGTYIGSEGGHILPVVNAKLKQDLRADRQPLYRFLPVKIRMGGGGFAAEPVSGGPGSLQRFVNSNGFILVPPNKTLKKDEVVEVTLFSKEELQHLNEV